MHRILILALAFAVLCPAAPAGAQARGREPRRPRLEAAADTNSASAYYSHGVRILERAPAEAADAFYWATRLEPGWADAWYARRIALLMSRPERFGDYLRGARRVIESAEMRAIDSLHYRALMLNPFVRTKFDKQAFEYQVRHAVKRENPNDRIDDSELGYLIDQFLRLSGPSTRAWVAYGDGRFPEALSLYATALRGARGRSRSGIHAERARIFLLVGRPDSAVAEMTRAVEQMRERDDRDLVFLYESKALYEHSIGVMLEQQGNAAGAREAYGRALQEDLSYYPAHVALASLALSAGDTTTALSEMDLAVQIRGDEPTVLHTYGHMLAAIGRTDEAAAQFRRAIAAEPYYAEPYLLLGIMLERKGDVAGALEQYRAFLARASRNHQFRVPVQTRVDQAGAGGGTTREVEQ
ncbi:MAG TPA: tetratricopeptide repeat protein [Longimicrobiaceae bacterium]|nr:tetratricopeptide repeat protein [Longimicrobiaceae bacterium]